jgi:hypothetical protein
MLYKRGLAVLETPDSLNDDLREQFAAMLKAAEGPLPKAAPPKRAPAAPAKKKTDKQ